MQGRDNIIIVIISLVEGANNVIITSLLYHEREGVYTTAVCYLKVNILANLVTRAIFAKLSMQKNFIINFIPKINQSIESKKIFWKIAKINTR